MLHRVCCPHLLFGFSELWGGVDLQALQVITYHASFIVEFFRPMDVKCCQVETLSNVPRSVGLQCTAGIETRCLSGPWVLSY